MFLHIYYRSVSSVRVVGDEIVSNVLNWVLGSDLCAIIHCLEKERDDDSVQTLFGGHAVFRSLNRREDQAFDGGLVHDHLDRAFVECTG